MNSTTFTIAEFAGIAGVKRDTVYKWIKDGRLPKRVKHKIIAGKNFIRVPNDLCNFEPI